jgi:hypothetical protein
MMAGLISGCSVRLIMLRLIYPSSGILHGTLLLQGTLTDREPSIHRILPFTFDSFQFTDYAHELNTLVHGYNGYNWQRLGPRTKGRVFGVLRMPYLPTAIQASKARQMRQMHS